MGKDAKIGQTRTRRRDFSRVVIQRAALRRACVPATEHRIVTRPLFARAEGDARMRSRKGPSIMLEQQQEHVVTDDTIDVVPRMSILARTPTAAATGEEVLSFRAYTLFPASRTLLRNGDPVCIGGRAFDLLVILLRNRGTVTPKNAITDYVWPATYLEESNLRFQVAALRRVLGPDADLIKTVPGRGYLLAADASANPAQLNDDGVLEAPLAIGIDPARLEPAAPGTPAALLEELLHSVALLVASYGSLEGFLSALGSHQVPVANRLPPGPCALSFSRSRAEAGRTA